MIKYSLIPRKNPITKEIAYHATGLPVTPIMLEQIAEEISSQCTLTAHDIKAVVSALEEVIFKHLRNGNSVRLGDLGSFHARLTSKGSASEDDFKIEHLRGIRVRFLPSSKLRYELSLKNPNVKLLKVTELVEE